MQSASFRVGSTPALLVGVAGLFALMISPPAHPMSPPPAQTWYVRATATGAGTGHDWLNAFTLFESALTAASSGDQIWVAEGTYLTPLNSTTLTHTFYVNKTLRIYGAFKGVELSPDTRQGSAALTVLEGNLGGGAHAEHIVTVNQVAGVGGNPGLILDGFTVQNGKDPASGHGGGGVYCDAADVQLVGCIIRNNSADYGGDFTSPSPADQR